MSYIDFNKVRDESIAQIDSLVSNWLQGKRNGHEFQATNPTRNDKKTGSFNINLDTGVWDDFADASIDPKLKADPIGLYAYLNNLSWTDAARELAIQFGLMPEIPEPFQHHSKLGKPSQVWRYNDEYFVYRFETKKGKEFRPVSWNPENKKWQWKDPKGKLPLYNLDDIRANSDARIIFCEGEKAADAAKRFFPDAVTTTTAHGAKSPQRTNFKPLKERLIIIWQDNDEAGRQYAEDLVELLLVNGEVAKVEILIIPNDFPEKGDAADALDDLDISNWELVDQSHMRELFLSSEISDSVTNSKSNRSNREELQKFIDNYAGDMPALKASKNSTPTQLVYKDNWGNPKLLKQNQAAQILVGLITELKFDAISEEWMLWKCNYWQRSNNTAAMKIINDSIGVHAGNCGYSVGYVSGISAFLRWELMTEEWNEKRDIIPFKNGVLDLESKALTPHKPEQLLTWQLPYCYAPESKCQPIIDWLKETVEDDAQVELLRAYLNCIVLGRVELQRYLELIGPGGSGKSTFLRLAEALVGGPNTHITELARLEAKDSGRFETANLYGKRLVLITDADNFAGDVNRLKAMVGNDPLPYEEKNKQGSRPNFRCQAMIIVAANEPIKSKDYTSALARRRITMRFNQVILSSKRRDLEREFEPYLPGLLNWVLEIPQDRVTELVRDTESHVLSLSEITRDNLLATNVLARWLDECVVHDPDAATKIGRAYRDKDKDGGYQHSNDRLYPSYCEFVATSNLKPIEANRFSDLLIDLCRNQLGILDIGKLPRSSDGIKIKGLRIRAQYEDAPSPIDKKFNGNEISLRRWFTDPKVGGSHKEFDEMSKEIGGLDKILTIRNNHNSAIN